MNDRDPNRLADQLEREAQELQRRSGELQDHVKEVQEDWQRKRADQSIPGAQPEMGDNDAEGERSNDDASSDRDE